MPLSSTAKSASHRRLTADIIIGLCGSALLFWLGQRIEFFEWLYELTRDYEHYDLDELLLVLLSLIPASFWFALRRWQEAAHLNQQISQLAYYDSLTQLPNRARSLAQLEQHLQRAQQQQQGLGVLYIDFDNFKQINDQFGHATGDAFLCRITERLQGATRSVDFLGRIGGDEFLLLIDDCHDERLLEAILARLYQALAAPIHIQQQHLQASMSIGIALYPHNGRSSDELIRAADAAMYNAKAAGRNQAQRA